MQFQEDLLGHTASCTSIRLDNASAVLYPPSGLTFLLSLAFQCLQNSGSSSLCSSLCFACTGFFCVCRREKMRGRCLHLLHQKLPCRSIYIQQRGGPTKQICHKCSFLMIFQSWKHSCIKNIVLKRFFRLTSLGGVCLVVRGGYMVFTYVSVAGVFFYDYVCVYT